MSRNPYFRKPLWGRRTDSVDADQQKEQPELPLAAPAHDPPQPVRTIPLQTREPIRRSAPLAAAALKIEPLLTGKELARLIGLSHRTLERMRVEGGDDPLPYIKLGDGKRAAVRYRSSDVMAWLERHARTSTSEA
jgi:predicted DNA-binding transcriptional regulator AlpA